MMWKQAASIVDQIVWMNRCRYKNSQVMELMVTAIYTKTLFVRNIHISKLWQKLIERKTKDK